MDSVTPFRTAAGAALLALCAMLAAPPAAGAADGKTVFRKCMACHKLDAGKHGIGPSLHGVFDRAAGSLDGFRYSRALRDSGIVWTRETLDAWIKKPKALVPGTRMPFAGLPSADDRAALIDFLEAATR